MAEPTTSNCCEHGLNISVWSCVLCSRKQMNYSESPNDTASIKKMRSDLRRINKLINDFEERKDTRWGRITHENEILRELLTSWQGVTEADYQTDVRLHLNMLTKRMCDTDD